MKRRRLARVVALLAALLAAPYSGYAEQLPSRARGLAADSVYQVGDLDNLNLFNGISASRCRSARPMR